MCSSFGNIKMLSNEGYIQKDEDWIFVPDPWVLSNCK